MGESMHVENQGSLCLSFCSLRFPSHSESRGPFSSSSGCKDRFLLGVQSPALHDGATHGAEQGEKTKTEKNGRGSSAVPFPTSSVQNDKLWRSRMLTLPALSYSPRTGANLVVKLALRLSGSPFPGPQDSKAVFLLEFICYQTQVPPLGHPWVKSGRYKRKNKRKKLTKEN